jgi:hypothetical protein
LRLKCKIIQNLILDVIKNLPKKSADDFVELIGADQNGALRKEIEDRKRREQMLRRILDF